jgi:hypothetical protein
MKLYITSVSLIHEIGKDGMEKTGQEKTAAYEDIYEPSEIAGAIMKMAEDNPFAEIRWRVLTKTGKEIEGICRNDDDTSSPDLIEEDIRQALEE